MTLTRPIERPPAPPSAAPDDPWTIPVPAPRRPSAGDRGTRLVGAACLVGVAVTHVFDTASKLESAPYLGWMFIALIVGSLVLATLLASGRLTAVAWPLAALLAANAIAGYLWSRAVGLPGIEDHIGHWRDAFGTASLAFEAGVIAVSVPRIRARAAPLAGATALMAAGLVGGGVLLGAAEGHGHGGANHHEEMNVDAATLGEKREATKLQGATIAVARQRFPTIAAAQAAGYEFGPRSFRAQRELDFWHLTNRRYARDGRTLDPERPESLMYWNDTDGAPQLMATVYRIPARQPNPALGGPIIQWHRHKNHLRGGLGNYKMTHIWHLPRLKDAYAMSMPVWRLRQEARFADMPKDGDGAGA